MPLPTSVPETAEGAYARVAANAYTVKSNLTGMANLLGPNPPGPVLTDNLISLYQVLNAAQAVGRSIQGVDGLSDYAKAQNGADYDIDAAFMASIVAGKAVTDWILANAPSDGQGGFVAWRHQADGTIIRPALDTAALAPLAALIATALATFS